MDPLADKLSIVAALVSLVALDRLQAWIAMVIIARELAVTGLRAVAVEQGVVISASWLGKVKTALQIAAVIALIAVDPATTAVDMLVYAAVAHGGLRCRLLLRGAPADRGRSAPRRAGGPAGRAGAGPGLAGASSHSRIVMCGRVLAGLELGEDLGKLTGALGDDVVAMDRLEVLLAGEDEAAAVQVGVGARRRRRTISRTQSSTKRGLAWAFSTTERSSARFISS